MALSTLIRWSAEKIYNGVNGVSCIQIIVTTQGTKIYDHLFIDEYLPLWNNIEDLLNIIIYFSEYCEIFGERHKVGEYFVPKDCHGYCRCSGPESFGCVSLCPPHGIYCIPGTRKVRTVRPVFPGSNCTCPSWKCVKGESYIFVALVCRSIYSGGYIHTGQEKVQRKKRSNALKGFSTRKSLAQSVMETCL